MQKYSYNDGSFAISDDKKVIYTDRKGCSIAFTGFPSAHEAVSFMCLGDFNPIIEENDFVAMTKSKYKIRAGKCN